MNETIRSLIAALEREFGATYLVWHVPVYLGLDKWCAKRHDGTGKIHNADSATELTQMIVDEIKAAQP